MLLDVDFVSVAALVRRGRDMWHAPQFHHPIYSHHAKKRYVSSPAFRMTDYTGVMV
jgi:hypothetical protein